jgi:hypothetical protein
MIAATALEHGLTIVTRNVSDFEPTTVTVLDPVQPAEAEIMISLAWRARRDSNCSTNILAHREFFAQFWSEGQVEGQDGGKA